MDKLVCLASEHELTKKNSTKLWIPEMEFKVFVFRERGHFFSPWNKSMAKLGGEIIFNELYARQNHSMNGE